MLIRPDTTPFVPELEAKLQGAGAAVAATGVGQGAAGGALGSIEAGAAGAAAGVETSTAQIGRSVEQVAGKVESASKSGGANWLGFSRLFSSEAGNITGAGNMVTGQLGEMDAAGLGATNTLTGLGPAFTGAAAGAIALAAVVVGTTMLYEKWGSSVFRVMELTGASADQSSRIVYAFNSYGISVDQVATFLGRFSRNLQSGNLDLQRYGLEIAHTKDGAIDLNGTLLNLADAMQRLGPGAEANTLAISALGRGGAALVPILVQGRQALEDLYAQTPQGDLITEAQAQRAHELGIQLRQLQIDAKALGVEFGATLGPAVLRLVQYWDDEARALGTLVHWYQQAWTWASNLVSRIPVLGDEVHRLTSLVGGHTNSMQDNIDAMTAAAQASDAQQAALERAQQKTQDLTTELNNMSAAADKMVDDERALAAAHDQRGISLDELNKAEKSYNDLLKVNGEDTKAAASAAQSLASARTAIRDANRSLASSEESIHEKQVAYDTAVDEFGIKSDEAAKALDDLENAKNSHLDASDRLTKAQQDETKAQADLKAAQPGSVESLQRLADAKDKVTQKSKAFEDAVYAEARAHTQLTQDLDAASGKTDTARDKTDLYRRSLGDVAATLDVNSPLRKNIEDYIKRLDAAYTAESKVGLQAGIYGDAGGYIPQGSTVTNIFNLNGVSDPAASAATIDALMAGGLPPVPKVQVGPTKQAATQLRNGG